MSERDTTREKAAPVEPGSGDTDARRAEPAPAAQGSADTDAPGLHLPGRLLAKNTILNLVGQGMPLLVVLFAVPFLIEHLGADRAGILSLGIVIVNSSTIFDLGLGRALRKLVAEALGRGERERIAEITWTAVLAQLVFGGLGGLGFALATPSIVGGFLEIAPELQAEARGSFYLIGAAIPLMIITDSLVGLMEASQRFDLVNAIKVPFIFSILLLPVGGVLLGFGLPGITALQLGSVGVFVLVQFVFARHVFPEIGRWPRPTRAMLRRLLGFGGWVMVSNAVGPVLMYLDRLAIGALLSMAALTAYTAPFELVTHLTVIPMSMASTLFPAFSTLSGRGELGRLREYSARAVKILLATQGPMVLAVIVLSHEILQRWLGPEMARQSTLTLQILAVGVLANSLAHVPLAAVQAQGRPDLSALFHVIELPVHAVLAWLFVSLWGIPGAALAWTVRVTLDAALLFGAQSRLFSRALAAEIAPRPAEAPT